MHHWRHGSLVIQSGRFVREEDALKEALRLWENRERRRAETLAGADEAESALALGEGHNVATRDQADRFADEIKQRGIRIFRGTRDIPELPG